MQAADECVSHILMPDDRGNVADKVVTVLERSGSVVDEALRRMCAAKRKALDLKRQPQLCHSLKATGVCL